MKHNQEPRNKNKPCIYHQLIFDRGAKNKCCWGNWVVTCKRMKFYIYCTKYTKINLKQIKNSDVRPKTIKLLKKKRRENVSWHWSWQWTFGYDTKSTGNKNENNPEGLHHRKEIINKIKSQPKKWEKIICRPLIWKGLISKIYMELVKLNSKKPTVELKTGQKIWIDTFPKKTYKWATVTWNHPQHH